jgi:hypothetical protein
MAWQQKEKCCHTPIGAQFFISSDARSAAIAPRATNPSHPLRHLDDGNQKP